MGPSPVSGGRPLLLLTTLLLACGEPTAPPAEEVEILPRAGEGAVGLPGEILSFEAVVVSAGDGAAQSGIVVEWRVARGDAALQGPGSSVSDSAGVVSTAVAFGETPGAVRVEARLRDAPERVAAFDATLAGRPRLDGLEPSLLVPGESVLLKGEDFPEDPREAVVLFSGIRGLVTEASARSLRVEVPPCLPTRPVEVTVQRGTLVSGGQVATVVAEGTPPRVLAPGEAVDIQDPGAPGCLHLDGGASYALLLGSTSTVSGARYPVRVRTLAGAPATVAAASPGPASTRARWGEHGDPEGMGGRFAAGWEAELRRRAIPRSPAAGERAGGAAVQAPPALGDRRSFRVLNRDGETEEVSSVARYVGEKVAIYLDEEAPEEGFQAEDLERLARTFDEDIHPVVTGVFGTESDLDGNGRVIMLLTPVVNRLTPAGTDGFIGGFFFGLDLRPGDGGNDGEVFYAVVPDPQGIHGDPRTRERLLRGIPAVLAHEFQHMVHFHQRAVLRDGVGTGALWLSEGLAQMAEELVARSVEAGGRDSAAAAFRDGNRIRARRYLADPSGTSLVVGTGSGNLEERGASWLFLLYAADRWGSELLGALTRTTRTAVESVEEATGSDWPSLLKGWWTALLAEGLGSALEETFPDRYREVDLETLLAGGVGDPWPLIPQLLADGDGLAADTLFSASPAFHEVPASGAGSVLLRVGGAGDGPVGFAGGLSARIVRIR